MRERVRERQSVRYGESESEWERERESESKRERETLFAWVCFYINEGQTKKQAGGERERDFLEKEINRHNENASRLDIDN